MPGEAGAHGSILVAQWARTAQGKAYTSLWRWSHRTADAGRSEALIANFALPGVS